jgi:hypothetical protein
MSKKIESKRKLRTPQEVDADILKYYENNICDRKSSIKNGYGSSLGNEKLDRKLAALNSEFDRIDEQRTKTIKESTIFSQEKLLSLANEMLYSLLADGTKNAKTALDYIRFLMDKLYPESNLSDTELTEIVVKYVKKDEDK